VNIVIVTGIWPPDAGGPASHGQALGRYLHGRGHAVEVVTTATSAPDEEPFPVRWVTRGGSASLRHLRVAALVRTRSRRADIVYATSMVRRAAVGAGMARRPLVVKLVSDEVFERFVRDGRFSGTLEEFQRARGARVALLRWTRTRALRRAVHVLSPSAYLRGFALGWGLDPRRVSVLPNPAPAVPSLPPREETRSQLDLHGPVLAFAGRLAPQKSLGVALEALARTSEVTLVIAGDGPERKTLQERAHELGLDGRTRFLGRLDRYAVLRLFHAADASLLSSSWENSPHSVVESLAVGTPVIATTVGGVPEIVRDGENGLLVEPDDERSLAAALERFFSDGELRRRLAGAAAGSVAARTEQSVFARIETVLTESAA
jgi:glycosyltransferase involved in cell wall biosynthesis